MSRQPPRQQLNASATQRLRPQPRQLNAFDRHLERLTPPPPSPSSPSGQPGSSPREMTAKQLTQSPATLAFRRIGGGVSDAVFGGAGSVHSAVLTLASCTIGTGVLALPAAFAESGVAAGLALLLLSAGFNVWSCMLLVHSSVLSRRFSYRSIGVAAFGEAGGRLVKLAVVLVLFGIITGLLVVLRDSIYEVVELFSPGHPASRWVLSGGVVLALVLPLSLPASIAALKYTSMLALASICFVTYTVCAAGVHRVHQMGNLTAAIRAAQAEAATGGNFWLPVQDDPAVPGWLKVITNIPVFCMAFACQVQVPDIFKTLKGAGSRKSTKGMQMVVTGALCGCLVLYLSIALLGVLAFVGAFTDLHGDVLDSLMLTINKGSAGAQSLRTEISAARVIMCISVSLTCPLLVLPCRDTIMQMLLPEAEEEEEVVVHRRSSAASESAVGGAASSASASAASASAAGATGALESGRGGAAAYRSSPLARPLLDRSNGTDSSTGALERRSRTRTRTRTDSRSANKSKAWPCWRLAAHGCVTVFILTTGWALANSIPNLKLVLGFTGSTGGSLLLYVLPALFYLKLLQKSRDAKIARLVASGRGARSAEADVPQPSAWALFFGVFPLIVGIVVGVCATGATVYGVVSGSHDNNMTATSGSTHGNGKLVY